MICLLDGIMCPAFYLTGNPRRAAYIYDTPEGQNDLQIRVSNSLVFVPDDDGDSWNSRDGADRGAHGPGDPRHGDHRRPTARLQSTREGVSQQRTGRSREARDYTRRT